MPVFRLETNAKAPSDPSALKSELTSAVSSHLGKPDKFVIISVVTGMDMCMGGDSEAPCGSATLSSIGGIGVEENKRFAAAAFPLLEKHLGIKADRCYINFVDLERANVGWNGSTFHK